MRERSLPQLSTGGFEDFSYKVRTTPVEAALMDMSAISQARGEAHIAANLFYPLTEADNEKREETLAWRASLREKLGGAAMAARWALFRQHAEFASVDLVRVHNQGDWEATAMADINMGEIAAATSQEGLSSGLIARESPEAKRTIMLDRHFLLRELTTAGLIAVRRKRLALVASPPEENKRLEIDKVSEFVLDIRRMAHVAPDAMFELDLRRGITRPTAGGLVDRTIEAAIADRDAMLTPATTTYYGERKAAPVKTTEASSRLVDAADAAI